MKTGMRSLTERANGAPAPPAPVAFYEAPAPKRPEGPARAGTSLTEAARRVERQRSAAAGQQDERLQRTICMDRMAKELGRDSARLLMQQSWPHPDSPQDTFTVDRNGTAYAPDIGLDAYDFDTDWIIEGILPRGALAGLVGPTQGGKSAMAQWIACGDGTLFGREIKLKGRVLMSLAEGQKGAIQRMTALVAGRDLPNAAAARDLVSERVKIPRSPISLADPNLVQGLIETVRRDEIDLVVFDTYGRSLGADQSEQDNDTANAITADLAKVINATGVTILIIHHFGWGDKRARGASAWGQSLDTVLHVDEKGGGWEFYVKKQRDEAPLAEHIRYKHVGVGPFKVGQQTVTGVGVERTISTLDEVSADTLTRNMKTPSAAAKEMLCSAVAEAQRPITSKAALRDEYNALLRIWCNRNEHDELALSDGSVFNLLSACQDLVASPDKRGEAYTLTDKGQRLLDGVEWEIQ